MSETSDYRELLIGCGHSREKRMAPSGQDKDWKKVTTLDWNEKVSPDIVCDLNVLPWGGWHEFKSPLTSGSFDEIHAYEVLEHLGSQGDHLAFFAHFGEIYRLLKPNGFLCATVPSRFSPWLWGDPSHRRAILPESLTFLDQEQYIKQLDGARTTTMSDFRNLWHGDFRMIDCIDNKMQFMFMLQAVKPSRIPERFVK